MYGCAITCSDTSSSLGVSQACLRAASAGSADLAVALFLSSNFTLRSLTLAPWILTEPEQLTSNSTNSLPREAIHRQSPGEPPPSPHRSPTLRDMQPKPRQSW